MIRKLFYHSLIGLLGLWTATKLIPGVSFSGSTEIFIFCGLVLGFANAFIKPIVKVVSFPLLIITLGLFSSVINLAILEAVDIVFPELNINGLIPLFLTSLIISIGTVLLYPRQQHHYRKKE